MDTNKIREQAGQQFEVFYAEYEKKREANGWMPLDTHVVVHMRNAWIASREAVVVELGAPSHWVADYAACGGGMTVFDAEKAAKVTDPMCSKTPAYTIHALEKAGLKVAP